MSLFSVFLNLQFQSNLGFFFIIDQFFDIFYRCEREILENGNSDLDSEIMAQMEDDFTQERQDIKPTASQDLSADYTTDVQDKMETSLHESPVPCKRFQFSGFSNEVTYPLLVQPTSEY